MQKPMQKPPFPELVWDEFWWSAPIQLGAWAGFESWQGPHGVRSSKGSPTGITTVRVWPHGDNPEEPTPAQAAAYSYLLANQQQLRDTILATLYGKYPGWRMPPALAAAGLPPEPLAATQLSRVIGLVGINIFTTEKDGLAYVGYELSCPWDEQGLGVMTHDARIVLVDGIKTAIMESVAQHDKAGQPPAG